MRDGLYLEYDARRNALSGLPPIEREIARYLHKTELQSMADRYAGAKQDVPRNIAATLIKAYEERSHNALEQLERELERMFEEEEVAALLMLTQ